jgi:hypothetical protein
MSDHDEHQQHLRDRITDALDHASVDAILHVVEAEVARRTANLTRELAQARADLELLDPHLPVTHLDHHGRFTTRVPRPGDAR